MRVFLSAAEPSGDALGAGLLDALAHRVPLQAFGMGGDACRASGLDVWRDLSAVSVMGLGSVLARLPALLWTLDELGRRAIAARPDVAVLVDAPAFHVHLGRRLRRHGIPVVQYKGPSVWAWGPRRARSFRDACDRLLVLFPFERSAWDEAGVDARWVGHPLVDGVLSPDSRGERDVWALLPGSRPAELAALLPVLLAWVRYRPGRFVLPLAAGLDRARAQRALRDAGVDGRVRLVDGSVPHERHAAIIEASAAVVCSGTATLEVALLKRPQVIVYRTDRLTYGVMSTLARVPYIGLPNLLAGAPIVPELIQGDLAVDRLDVAASRLERSGQVQALAPAMAALRSRAEVSGRAAQAVAELVSAR